MNESRQLATAHEANFFVGPGIHLILAAIDEESRRYSTEYSC
jgi:hypothetical protein